MAGNPSLRRYQGQALSALGVLSATSSVISLIQKIGDITLFGVFAMYLKLYRDITHPLIELLPNCIHLNPPLVMKDFWVLSALFTTLTVRAMGGRVFFGSWLILVIASLILTYSFLGLLFPFLYAAMVFYAPPPDPVAIEGALAQLFDFTIGLLAVIVASSFYFLLNVFVGFGR